MLASIFNRSAPRSGAARRVLANTARAMVGAERTLAVKTSTGIVGLPVNPNGKEDLADLSREIISEMAVSQ